MPPRTQVQEPIPHFAAVSDPAFLRTMHSVFEGDVQPGHSIRTLVNGDEIFPPMLSAIREAQVSVNFVTYIYWSSEIAREFATALAEKARDGVPVRVLVDFVGAIPFDEDTIKIMTDANVNFERFRPIHWYTLDRINYRTHRKLLIVDGKIGFTGGVGIGDQWLGDARNPEEWRDNHYRVEGPVVADMQAAFAENWIEATGEVLQGDQFYPEAEEAGDLRVQHVKSSPNGGAKSMHQMLMMAMAGATENIRIAMAYFVPDDVAIAQLLQARERGVEIDIIVPGKQTDMPIVRHGSRHFWGELLEAGIRLHEYQPTMYHPKVLIVDEWWTTIGSTNFDERSFRLNDESNLNVYDGVFAKTQIDLFEADLSLSRQVTLEEWQNRPVWEKTKDWVWSWLRTQL
ncbi:phospholipase D-like domain-containing protein [Aureimonas fodinaquatilis]|uniref:phospholipase D-like domain-containing protein n=1 Tax=Aureimonas fodinaquatilis TaxID=2565783 RepID=UPI001FE44ED7|nr:phospholipase D-like domain-containing protein [Aureimonas fodinaquatilis]